MMTQDDLSQYEVKPIQEDLSQYEVKVQQPSFGEESTRIATQLAARGLETAIGLPGDITRIAEAIYERNPVTKFPFLEKEVQQDKRKPFLPTSSEFREMSKRAHQEALEPQSRTEEIAGNIVGDLILAPGSLTRKIAISTFGNLGQETAKEFGAGEKGQIGAKIAAGFLASRFGQKNVKDFYKEEFEAASRSIPKDALRSGKRIENFLEASQKNINQGGYAPWKTEINTQIDALKKNIKNGAVPVKAIDQAVKDINSHLRQVKIDPQAERWLMKLKTAAQHELKQYGKTNPEFIKHYQDANAAFSGFQQSRIASKYIDKIKDMGLLKGISAGAIEFIVGGPEALAKTVAIGGATIGAAKQAEFIGRIFSNPILFKYYTQTLASAAKENSMQVLKNIQKFDEEFKKDSITK